MVQKIKNQMGCKSNPKIWDQYWQKYANTAHKQASCQKGMEKGIQALIEDNREDGVSEERIIEKLQKRFSMDRGKAESYLERFTQK